VGLCSQQLHRCHLAGGATRRASRREPSPLVTPAPATSLDCRVFIQPRPNSDAPRSPAHFVALCYELRGSASSQVTVPLNSDLLSFPETLSMRIELLIYFPARHFMKQFGRHDDGVGIKLLRELPRILRNSSIRTEIWILGTLVGNEAQISAADTERTLGRRLLGNRSAAHAFCLPAPHSLRKRPRKRLQMELARPSCIAFWPEHGYPAECILF
jgi:hypothetical protein